MFHDAGWADRRANTIWEEVAIYLAVVFLNIEKLQQMECAALLDPYTLHTLIHLIISVYCLSIFSVRIVICEIASRTPRQRPVCRSNDKNRRLQGLCNRLAQKNEAILQ